MSYYLINGVLNFNVVFILALLAPLAVEFQVSFAYGSINVDLALEYLLPYNMKENMHMYNIVLRTWQ